MLATTAAGLQVLQDKLQGVVMHRGGSYPKAEQPPCLTKNLQGMIIFSNFFLKLLLKEGCG
jgi:hypothetical protein